MWYFLAVIGGIILGAAAMFLAFGKNYKKFQWAYTVLQNYTEQAHEATVNISERVGLIEKRIDEVIERIKKELEDMKNAGS